MRVRRETGFIQPSAFRLSQDVPNRGPVTSFVFLKFRCFHESPEKPFLPRRTQSSQRDSLRFALGSETSANETFKHLRALSVLRGARTFYSAVTRLLHRSART